MKDICSLHICSLRCSILSIVLQVLLPTGTFVKISLLHGNVNVGVVASPADRESSEGLCGWYDGVPDNDLRLQDGQIIRAVSSNKEAPAFSKAWK
jgi:hypothetical protein